MADVEITYKLIPNESSLKASAEKLSKSIGRSFSSSDTSKMLSDIQRQEVQVAKYLSRLKQKDLKDYEKYLMNEARIVEKMHKDKSLINNIYRLLSPRQEFSTKVKAAKNLGMDPESVGGIAKILGVISVEILIIAAFFEAVGPIIKTTMKILTMVILILLMPFIKLFLTILPSFAKFLIDASKFFSSMIDSLLAPAKVGAGLIAGAFNLGDWIVQQLSGMTQSIFDIGKWIGENISKFISSATSFDVIGWLTKTIFTPLQQTFVSALSTLTKTDIGKVIQYFINKVTMFMIDAINFFVNALKGFKFTLPPIVVKTFWGPMTIFGGMNFDPFGGMSNVAPPAGLTQSIKEFESNASTQQQPQINYSPVYNINGWVDQYNAKMFLDYINRQQAQDLRNKVSYLGGTYQ